MDEAHTVRTMRYVERNPVRARMTRVPWTYKWSSAAAHAGRQDKTGVLDMTAWEEMAGGTDWKETLIEGDGKEAVAALRLNTQTGRPLASDSFLSKLEKTLGPRLRPLPAGRPKKAAKAARKGRK